MENNISLVHTNNQVHRDFYAIESARRAQVPCVSHLRSPHTEGFYSKKAKYVNQNVHAIFAYSHSIAECWENAGLDTGTIKVVHNAIETVLVKPLDIRRKYKLLRGRKIIGIIGMIIPERNHVFLLHCFKVFLKRHSDVHLMIVGDSLRDEKQNLMYLAEDLGISKHLTFTGYLVNAQELIASLDAIVMPYTMEPFGRILLEAWQLKTPTVISNVGHIEKIVTDRVNTLLFDVDSKDSLIQALEIVLYDQEIKTRLIENGFQHCNKNFSIHSYNEQIEVVYDQILNSANNSFYVTCSNY